LELTERKKQDAGEKHYKELQNLYSSPNTIRDIKSKRTIMMGYVTAMENVYILVAMLASLATNECSRKIPCHEVLL
jgi:hypothetical protein